MPIAGSSSITTTRLIVLFESGVCIDISGARFLPESRSHSSYQVKQRRARAHIFNREADWKPLAASGGPIPTASLRASRPDHRHERRYPTPRPFLEDAAWGTDQTGAGSSGQR